MFFIIKFARACVRLVHVWDLWVPPAVTMQNN